jgi:creatinine amidohydrolase
MARRASERLSKDDITAFILPSLAYAPAGYASEFPGTISIEAGLFKQLLIAIAQSVKAQGFACLAIANSHFDPANVTALREAVEEVRASGLLVAFPDFTRRALAQTLTEEFISGACHAGQFESSLVMADRADLVKNNVRASLDPNPSSLLAAFAKGAKNFADAGGPDAYFGTPHLASTAEGERTFRIMAGALVDAVRAELAKVA